MSFSSDIPIITNQLQQTINLPEIKQGQLFQERLEELLREISNSVNSKEGGLYSLAETGSSELFYTQGNPQQFRNVYRKVLDFIDLNGANIGAGAAVNFPHNIVGVFESAGIYAHCTATDGRRFTVVFPDVWIDGTDAFIVNPIAVELTQCDVILNVLKN
jgi:hypothetical protein